MREIGSEFWWDNIYFKCSRDTQDWINYGDDRVLLYSGRTAIDYILGDIYKKIKSIYMPSYCCQSMLQPFTDRNIRIEFYDVILGENGLKYIVDYEKPCDIFFATSYFGFSTTVMDSIIEVFNNKGVIVIEDITHRFLSRQAYCSKADYHIASLRKWFPIPSGGLAIKQKGSFVNRQLRNPSKFLIDTKIKAMTQKAEYINKHEKGVLTKEDDKKKFLDKFSEFNRGIKLEYKGIKIDNLSSRCLSVVDVDTVKKKRQENVRFFYESLRNYDFLKFLIKTSDFERDCPLFFPIRVKSEFRDKLRNHLKVNDIYCPIHWPTPKEIILNSKTRQLYDEELSLICDQRYNKRDMTRIVKVIENFFKDKICN